MFDGMNYMHVNRKKRKRSVYQTENITIFQKEKCLITFG